MVDKVLLCKCCSEPITEDNYEDAYVANEGNKQYVFCNMECTANWFGDMVENQYDDFDEFYKEFKEQRRKKK